MGWEQIKDYMNSFIAVAFLVIAFILIPEIRRSKKFVFSSIVFGVFLLWLGYDKINRDTQKEQKHTEEEIRSKIKLDSSQNKLSNIQDTLSEKIRRDIAFQNKLDSMFHIVKDSNNIPVFHKQTNNISINKMEDFIIGNKY